MMSAWMCPGQSERRRQAEDLAGEVGQAEDLADEAGQAEDLAGR